jgi:hypothetical protein
MSAIEVLFLRGVLHTGVLPGLAQGWTNPHQSALICTNLRELCTSLH